MQESLGADVGYEHGFTDLFGFDVSPARRDHDDTLDYADSANKDIPGSVGNINPGLAANFQVARRTWGTLYRGPIAGCAFAQDRANNALGLGAQVLTASTACSGSLPGPLRAATPSAAARPRISTSR